MAKKGRGINIFQHVPKASPNRTQFPIYHKCDFDGDFGLAYPVFCQEVLPGDTWHISADHFSRLAPMIAPVYHDFNVKFHWFYVPMRLLWDDFEDWMTGGKNGTWREDNPDSFPLFDLKWIFNESSEIIGTLFDFLGVNTCSDGNYATQSVTIIPNSTLPVMPVRGYWMIYNYFFRDQNVQDELEIPTTSGLDAQGFYDMLQYGAETIAGDQLYFFRVAWDKDYFTSATLSPQRGPQVYIPIGGQAPLITDTALISNVDFGAGVSTLLTVNADVSGNIDLQAKCQDIATSGTSPANLVLSGAYESTGVRVSANNFGTDLASLVDHVSVDMDSSQGAAVDDVREAFSLQRFFERMQIVGSRFSEFLRGIWGTNAGDARLQMPEYLGTWTNPFMINNVSNTTGTADNPQGGYAGNGMATQYNKPIHKNFPENGYLYCLYTALPRPGYQQGLAPIFCRRDWLHFANPYFEHIGEQPIEMEELYYDPSKSRAENEETFGYQSQYANYKFINSHSHGTFKTSLNFWHANRILSSKPSLSTQFIQYQPDESADRVFVLHKESKFYTTIQFDGYVERNLSAFSTPRLM